MNPVTDLDVWDRFISDLQVVVNAISGCLPSFLFLLVVYTFLLWLIFSFLYKHKKQNLECKEDNLRMRTEDVTLRENRCIELEQQCADKCNDLQEKYDALVKELSAPEYLQFKMCFGKKSGEYTDGVNLFD